ncbi:hypothetical protein BOX15_Mlig015659g1 [Macrostomum lignano]|uniref:Uncharacterized protein n=2 Tax=Macrostomum lignano TaxID=282301 RepID=A0A267GDZ9_9PLAT|nr:hypothetical protein BOX15_Mlig015659g1 [Macrostomum lignano]
MAELFWTMEKEPIAAALLSSMILKAMGGRTDDFTDKEDFQRGASQFEDYALGVLDQCYREDERRAQFLINRELAFYGDSSCIYLAAEGESIKFMAHPCCQDFLTSTWMGRLSPKNAMARFSFGILCGMCCPLLIPKVMLFKLTEEEAQKQQAITQQQQQQEEQQQQQQQQLQLQQQQRQQQLVKTPSPEGVVVDMNEDGEEAQYYPGQENVQSSESLNCRQVIARIRDFYMAPVIRFVYNTISYVAFLVIFSYMLLYELTHAIKPLEYVVIGWMVTLLLEEIKQATMSGISFSTYISDSWNKLDCIAVGLFTLGFILRMISLISDVQSDEPGYDVILTSEFFIIARICYAFSLFAYYIRLMYIFSFHIALGPKLIMIGKMVINDLVPFMVILLVFVLGYGVAAQSIAYPTGLYTPEIDYNKTFPPRMSQMEVLVNFLTKSYFQMFGEFSLETVQARDDGCKNDGQCPHWTATWLVPVMLGVYVLLTNILMFNLLIAMFSSTYELINQFSALHWNYQRYSMIKEYIERSPLAPPLIFIWHAYQLGFYIQLRYNGLRRSDLYDPLKIKYIDNVKKERELIKWEHMKAMDYLRNGQEAQQKSRGGRGDSKSIIVRTSGPQPAAGGGQSMFPSAAMDMAKQMTDATSGIGMELEKKFKGVDTQLNKLGADLDGRVGELSTAVQGVSQLLASVQETQRQILEKLGERPTEPIPAVDPQLESRVRSVVLEMYQAPPAWFEEAARQAASAALQATPVSVRELGSPVLEQLRPVQAPPPKPPTPPPPPPEEPPSPEEESSSSESDDDDRTTVRPQVDDPTTGRIIQYLTSDHRLWRYAPFNFEQYPGMRMNVPPDRIPWEIEYREYFAFDASDEVLVYPGPDAHDNPSVSVHSLPFNQYDSAHKLRRQSMMGRYRLDSNSGAPLNPMGRTGLKGKGLLPRWGPNNAAVVVMTRWNRAPSGAVIHRLGKPILQVVSLFRHKQFCLPWYLTDHQSHCDYDQCVAQFLKVFVSRRLKQLMQHRGARQEITAVQKGRAEQAIRHSETDLIFKGYLDDHLNSDNAWIEAVVINIHESEGWKFSDAMLKVFAEADCDEQVKWMEVAYSTALRSSHCELLKTVAGNHNAYF